MTMRLLLLGAVVCCVLTASPRATAQIVVLKGGQTAPAKGLRRNGATLYNTIDLNGHAGEVGYAIKDVDRLELPEPPQIGQAEQLILTGKPAEAVTLLEPIINAYYPLRDIKGVYWAAASLLKSAGLQAQGKRDEAAALLTLLAEYPFDPHIALTAKARLAGLLALAGKSRAPQAIALADSLLGTTEDSKVLAEVWLAKGRALFVTGDYDNALDAFLHLPVFYSDSPSSTAEALLGCGRCYLKLQDNKRAVRSLLSLQELYPTSPEAAEAKKEIEKGGASLASFVKQVQDDKAEADRKLKELSDHPVSQT